MMSDYLIYGGRLRSSVALPGPAPRSAARPDWTLRVSRRLDAMRSPRALGQERVEDGVNVRLFRHEGGFRLCYDDTGDFDVSRDGRRVRWRPPGSVEATAVQADVTGRVLPLALHASGVLALHGSAVAVDGKALIFVGPKFSGKSTLAYALARAGAGLLTDDVAPLVPGEAALLLPGTPSVRLWPDSAAQLAGRPKGGRVKVEIGAPAGVRAGKPVPAGMVYVVAPVDSDAVEATRRTRLPGPSAALALVAHARLGALLRGDEAGRLLAMASAVARVTPAYVLEVAWDLERLPDAARRILEWHRAST